MPLYKRSPFEPTAYPKDLKEDEQVYYLKLTNELFRDYDDYYSRVILCNSMVWSCSLTGKGNLTYQEALDSEKEAKKIMKGFPKPLRRAILYCVTLTERSRFADVVDDVLSYSRERYFKGEVVLGVVGNLWSHSKVLNIIEPTEAEIQAYRDDQLAKGDAVKNDYLDDDTWGPSPDIFRYEVEEVDSDDPEIKTQVILESIDVKREKASLSRDKVKVLLKLAMEYDETKRKFVLKDGIINSYGISKMSFSDIFVGKIPIFDSSLGPVKSVAHKGTKSSKKSEVTRDSSSSPKSKKEKSTSPLNKTMDDSGKKAKSKGEPKPKKEKERKLTPEELKQLEIEKRIREREHLKAQRKMVADFKKLWFKPKEDLEVEDLKDLPTPDPVSFSIPNKLFGDFMMVLEFMGSYSTFLKVRDCFPNGMTFDALERALTTNEIAGPFSDILQLLLRAVFRLQEGEGADVAREDTSAVGEVVVVTDRAISIKEEIENATSTAAWPVKYQNSPLYRLGLDYSSVTEVLRLHLLSSGAKMSSSCSERDDPGLYLRVENPEIIKTLSTGTVFDLTLEQKLKVIQCLVHQIMTYSAVKDIMDDSFEQFRQARANYRSLVAAEKRKEAEDHVWRQKLKADKVIPDVNTLKAAVAAGAPAPGGGEDDGSKGALKKDKGKIKIAAPATAAGATATTSATPTPTSPVKTDLLTDEQIEAQLAKKDKEIARRKQDFAWKEAELLDQINKHERKLGAHPLGRDRAFRRYWIFPTVAGVFVEHDDSNIGTCLKSPPSRVGEVDFSDMDFITENFAKLKQNDKEGSDKENSSSPKKLAKKKSINNAIVAKKETTRPSIFGMCTADKATCPVHGVDAGRIKWSFFWDSEHIDALISGLTPRGIREKDLRQNLVEAKDNIKGLIKKCPAAKLNKDNKYSEGSATAPDRRPHRGGSSKQQTDPNLGFPADTPVTKIMELHLRDLILEVEEKIFLGGLGSLKVSDRAEWRTAIENLGYFPGVEELKWGANKSLHPEKREVTDEVGAEAQSKRVKDLACAILQLQQAVESKFMKRPLVEKEEDKRKRKMAESEASWKAIWNSKNTQVDRWEISLMQCSSFPQLFVHFYTLESSIEWSRSVLNARCRLCRRKGDPEKMLLCDTCNKGQHIYCLKPPMETLPKGDWFCVDCRPDEALPTPSKRRRLNVDEEDLEEEEDQDDDTLTGDDLDGKKKGDDDDETGESEGCYVCGFGGEVICCDSCPLMFHLLCLDPPKTRVPRGSWFCPECTNPRSKARKAHSPVSSKNKGRKRKRPTKRRLQYDDTDEESSASESLPDSFIDSDS